MKSFWWYPYILQVLELVRNLVTDDLTIGCNTTGSTAGSRFIVLLVEKEFSCCVLHCSTLVQLRVFVLYSSTVNVQSYNHTSNSSTFYARDTGV